MSKTHKLLACSYFLVGFMVASIIYSSKNDSPGNLAKQYAVSQPIYKNETKGANLEDEQMSKNNITTIHLIGERHCGTKWITNHLTECFGDDVRVFNRYSRWKHWFQYEDEQKISPGSALVVAMFRDPYDWIDSMRKKPYHSPNHFNLDWKEFLTRPWTMERGPADKGLLKSNSKYNTTCMHRFPFDEVIPCSRLDRNMYNGTMNGKTVGVTYELNHDGSGQAYDSILELRSDKIKNFLGLKDFDGVGSFIPVQFEYMVTRGTSELINEVENLTGIRAHCKGTQPQLLRSKTFDPLFVEWMNEHLDWETERLIGYNMKK